jgi:hypothetical protein
MHPLPRRVHIAPRNGLAFIADAVNSDAFKATSILMY